MVTEAIILAGGLGTRLRSVAPDVPKAMAPIAGQPFLAYLLQFLETQGITRVILAVGYRNEAIRDFFGDRYHFLGARYQLGGFAPVGREPLQELSVRQFADRPHVEERVELPQDSPILSHCHDWVSPPYRPFFQRYK